MMASKAMGTTQRGDLFTVTVRHHERDSYSRSVAPAARRNLRRLYPYNGFQEVRGLIDNARRLDGGMVETDWVFQRTS